MKMGMSLTATVAMCCSLIAGAAAAERSLTTELEVLLKTNPKLLAAAKSIEAAQQGIREAESGFYPKVTVSGDIGPEWVDSPTRRSAGQEAFRSTARSTSLTVTQNLFEGFRTTGQTRIAELRKDVSSLNFDITQQTVLLDGIRAYISVLKQSRLLEIAKTNEQTLQTQLNLESARVERGSGLAVDVLQAKSRLQLARERVVRIMGELRQAQSSYVEVFGHPAVPAQMILPPVPTALLPETVEAAEAAAAAENAVLRRSIAQIDIADEQRTVAESTYWPKIDLVGESNWEDDVDGTAGIRREGRIVLRASWDIFDGFLTPARSGRASAEYGAALDTRMTTDREVRDRVRRAWDQYRTTAEQAELLQNAVNIASEVFEARQKLRQSGRESVINLLDAENELNNARLRYNEAVFDNTLASYRVLLQTGRLTPANLQLRR